LRVALTLGSFSIGRGISLLIKINAVRFSAKDA
jgi:hypothetical protein